MSNTVLALKFIGKAGRLLLSAFKLYCLVGHPGNFLPGVQRSASDIALGICILQTHAFHILLHFAHSFVLTCLRDLACLPSRKDRLANHRWCY